ncbi:uncharacterized protein LY89DRAFT_760847 [Mollisia scopiformis]|uniref:Uncharacterized protein n=1 Tax=Mollisia scopiformis TaxID=149040 RepID=A0A132BCA8_MOLSC|nr:uncharacterized protein LY89DRAFT_760847 [Mollisia scopiformis]KUJ10026.1 hypothetical protein LY89DRAFT_760847 [Mollisia scopiformis]
MAIWEKQSGEIKAHVKVAEEQSDDATADELQKMLKNCNKLWMNKAVKVLHDTMKDETPIPRVADIFRNDLDKLAERVDSLIDTLNSVGEEGLEAELLSGLQKLHNLSDGLSALERRFEEPTQRDLRIFDDEMEMYGGELVYILKQLLSTTKSKAEK